MNPLFQALSQTWPARAVQSLYEAAKHPGEVYAGRADPMDVEKATDLAGLAMTGGLGGLGGMSGGAVLGAGPVRPRSFWRGENPGDARRIQTGANDWDSYLFMADNPDAASMYGRTLSQYEALPEAKILYEGTKDWRSVAGPQLKAENLLEYADRAAKAAKAAGYDAAWFKRQGDVGTAVFNPAMFPKKAPRT
jgi:hypothetical protein